MLCRKPELQLTNCWKLSVDKSGNCRLLGDPVMEEPALCELYLMKLYQVLLLDIREKSAVLLVRREDKNHFFKISKSILFFLTKFTLRGYCFSRV